MTKRPYIVTIAGFDPSSGAGLSADIKTFERLKCQGFAACTATTVQNDHEFLACHWQPKETIIEQINILFKRFDIRFVKIGIVENWTILNTILDHLHFLNPNIRIVLDPILSSSSNFTFHGTNSEELSAILKKIYLLTPNYLEIQTLFPEKTVEEAIEHIQQHTNLYLKGGHRSDHVGRDELYLTSGKSFRLNPKLTGVSEKHGSGCVLSAAITSYLANGFSMIKACRRAKSYTEKFLTSNPTLLGYHQ